MTGCYRRTWMTPVLVLIKKSKFIRGNIGCGMEYFIFIRLYEYLFVILWLNSRRLCDN